MKFFIFAAVVAAVANGQMQPPFQGQGNNNRMQGKFVWDLLKTPLTADEVQTIMSSRDANSYPQYNLIPKTAFDCAQKAQAGFYADADTQCQVFHRCDLQGNQTSYLCVNSTVFNQITLVCDSWFNVDCGRSLDYENFANSRLYTNQPLFDTPPADYISPGQLVMLQNQGVVAQSSKQPAAAQPSATLAVMTRPQQQRIIVNRKTK